MKRTLVQLSLAALVSSALFGCGSDGDGVNGTNSTVTVPVNVGNKVTVASNATTPTSAQVSAWRTLEPQVTVNSVTIASAPVVKFTVTDAQGNAVVGLGNKSQGTSSTSSSVAGLTNLRFTLAKLVPATASSPSKWVTYLVVKPLTLGQVSGTIAATDSCTADKTWCGTFPTTDYEGTLVDNGDGTYQYTFKRDITKAAEIVASLVDSTDTLKKKADLGDLSYNASLTHRLGIQISGAAPGTGSNTPTATTVLPAVNIAIPGNFVFDFRPDGQAVAATRSIVDIESCASCHNGKGLVHGGSRSNPNYCVTCHTDQIKYGMSSEATRASALVLSGTTTVINGRAVGDYPNMLHKLHMRTELTLSGYNFLGVDFKDGEWIQSPRNCTKCHSGVDKTDVNQAVKTKDGDNWKNAPSRLACGACHDNVDFAAGTITAADLTVTNHLAGTVTDDSTCKSCHTAAAIAEAHRAEAPTANNPVVIEGVSTISYEIASVTLNASRQPVFKFRIIKDGAPLASFATPTTTITAGAVVVPSTFEAIPGFSSGPTFYAAYAVPQDGITSPADFNTNQSVSLANLLVASGSPKAGTMTGPDVDGFFTATLTGDTVGQPVTATCTQKANTLTGFCVNPSPIVIPSTAKMLTGAMIGNFTQKTFTGIHAADLTAKFDPVTGTVSKGLLIKTPLKKLVATGFTARRIAVEPDKCERCHEQLGTAVEFHSGARNDPTACAICHNTSRTSGGWSANASTFVHGIHAGTTPAAVTAATATGTAVVGVPGSGGGGAGTGYNSGKRNIPFSWHRDKLPGDTTGFNAAKVVYPGILKRCDNCHVPNAVNFGANGATIHPNLLWTTSTTGRYNAATDANRVFPRDPVTGAVTYITADNVKNYGNLFIFAPEGAVVPVFTPSTGVATTPTLSPAGGTIVPADPETLVESPITAACFACHDSNLAKLHMAQYGGVIYAPRKESDKNWNPVTGLLNGGVLGGLVNKETCLVCHGMGRDQDVAAVHAK